MWTLVVVEAQIGREGGGPSRRAEIRMAIGPFAQQRLNEALGFAVGPRRVGPREACRTAQLRQARAKRRDRYPLPLSVSRRRMRMPASAKPHHRAPEKGRAGAAPLRATDFDIGHARRVVDRDVDVLLADAAAPRAPIAMDAMADPANAAERFDVEVQQIAGVRPLVALNHRRRLERRQPIQPRARQHARHRRARHPQRRADLPGRRARLAQRDDRRRRARAPGVAVADAGATTARQAVRAPSRASHLATVRTLTPTAASAACRCVQPWRVTRSISSCRIFGVVFALR